MPYKKDPLTKFIVLTITHVMCGVAEEKETHEHRQTHEFGILSLPLFFSPLSLWAIFFFLKTQREMKFAVEIHL